MHSIYPLSVSISKTVGKSDRGINRYVTIIIPTKKRAVRIKKGKADA
jgi:hypothetical protein